jgi:hypothetical protein
MRNWLKEPLLHFLLLGAGIFVLYGWIAGVDEFRSDEIRITSAKQKNLALTFARTWQRPPTQSELDGLVKDFIQEEIAYREGVAMQLDTDDIIVRRRLRQKLEIFAKDVVGQSLPSDEQLQQYMDENLSDYLIQPVYTFGHVLFRVDENAARARENAESALGLLRKGEVDVETLGDASLMPAAFLEARVAEINAAFGTGFAEQLSGLPAGEWHGPLTSGIGLHLIWISEFSEARKPALDEVRGDVTRDLQATNYVKGLALLYERLGEKYTIVVEPFVDEGDSASEKAQ